MRVNREPYPSPWQRNTSVSIFPNLPSCKDLESQTWSDNEERRYYYDVIALLISNRLLAVSDLLCEMTISFNNFKSSSCNLSLLYLHFFQPSPTWSAEALYFYYYFRCWDWNDNVEHQYNSESGHYKKPAINHTGHVYILLSVFSSFYIHIYTAKY